MIDRYISLEMKDLFSDESRFNSYLKIEIEATHAFTALGIVPESDYLKIKEKAKVDVKRIKEIEEVTKHDVVAFTRQISETLGEEKKWVHYELTSTDVVDSAMSLLYKKANEIILSSLYKLQNSIKEKAYLYKYTPCIGRTHGMHADITSFGLKWALYFDELNRQIERFKYARKEIEVCKISGAVGNFANVDPFVQDFVSKELGLTSANISTQVLQRDRHSFYGSVICNIGSTLEKIATEIRNLQRFEIHEVEEYFSKDQKGSSAMPHKRNPISSENIVGCSRLLRGYLIPLLEDNALYHERDISHSSVERVALIDMIELFDYMIKRMTRVIENLIVYEDKMKENISLSNNAIFAQRVLNTLIEKGKSREEAYDLVQPLGMKALNENLDFKDLVKSNETISSLIKEKELNSLFDYDYYLRNVDTIYKRVGL